MDEDFMEYELMPEDYALAESNGISKELLKQRFYKNGWNKAKATCQPVRRRTDRTKWLAIAEKNGINRGAFYERVRKGWVEEKAATEPLGKAVAKPGPKVKYPADMIELAEKNGIGAERFRDRVRSGWSYKNAATKPLDQKRIPADRRV
ncbi:hypothetical protein FHS19_006896 [Paenibacillus rhizosphaerae]|uniref:Uncharacterized protein n=1 Tax=Paenibacillus rhizosphaerae TaxID=297318 RepID=A0A839U3Z1_9BACL|nr:hypothetical protein [Paenibacillus rhizosphaerae]MBB3132169.1 hypothetical protein [Paenibacillus rhizosphaerae]